MNKSKSLPSRASFESIRKQAKKLARNASTGDAAALARIRLHLPDIGSSATLRNAQLALAREYGFAGWQDLRAAVLRAEGKGIEWAAGEGVRAVHDNKPEELRKLVEEFPALSSWRDEYGESLLDQAIHAYADTGDSVRDERYTRIACAEILFDGGATTQESAWHEAIGSRSRGVLDLLCRRGAAPMNLEVSAALGDLSTLLESLKTADTDTVGKAFLAACRFGQRDAATILLDRCIALDSRLGDRVAAWEGRAGFIDFLISHPRDFGSPWRTAVMVQLTEAIMNDDFEAFANWLVKDPELLGESGVAWQVQLLQQATLSDRESFIVRLLESRPAIVRTSPPPVSDALTIAIEYAHLHLVPLLSQIWPVPDDLCHAAGLGDFARVKAWFGEDGQPMLGDLANHFPTNNPHRLRDLHWGRPDVQHVLDVALGWSCINEHFDIADFLLDHGANIDTDWSTHEPASILHDCAGRGNFEVTKFLIDRGIDLTIRDYRWNGTAEGWARYASKNEEMADFLAQAEKERKES